MADSTDAPATALDVVNAFNAAWDAHDLDATLSMVTDDCVFESARPDALGPRVIGRDALRTAWGPGFAQPSGAMEIEEIIVAGDRVTQLWRFAGGDRVVRGVDVLRVRDGRIAEKFGYVKV